MHLATLKMSHYNYSTYAIDNNSARLIIWKRINSNKAYSLLHVARSGTLDNKSFNQIVYVCKG